MSRRLFIKAENIVHSYGEQTVLDFDRFYLYEGEKVGLVGRNGAGKSTLLKILSGETTPAQGSVVRECAPFTSSSLDMRRTTTKRITRKPENLG